MKTISQYSVALALTALLQFTTTIASAQDDSGKPVILAVIPDSPANPTQLTIAGQNLGTSKPLVTLDTTVLSVAAFTPTIVTVWLQPGWRPGTYQLTLETGGHGGKTAQFDVAVGALGSKGDPGPQGPAGPPGPQGPPGSGAATDVYSINAPAISLRIIPKAVASLTVPAGQYWIMFTSSVSNTTADLLNPIDSIACGFVNLGSPNTVRLPNDANQAVMTLQAVATFNAPATVIVNCAGSSAFFSGQSFNNVLTALKVGAIH